MGDLIVYKSGVLLINFYCTALAGLRNKTCLEAYVEGIVTLDVLLRLNLAKVDGALIVSYVNLCIEGIELLIH